tara:strand:- start:8607 stop:8900 length:294 start_codon:yes stop_codon:yes gene_type:complete
MSTMGENRFTKQFAEADSAFDDKYKKELDHLRGLSRSEINALTPGTSDAQIYLDLIKVVEQASKENLSQAELVLRIKGLGETAVKIAKKVPLFASLL